MATPPVSKILAKRAALKLDPSSNYAKARSDMLSQEQATEVTSESNGLKDMLRVEFSESCTNKKAGGARASVEMEDDNLKVEGRLSYRTREQQVP